MKIPTLEELIEISKKFRLEDLSHEGEIILQKQIDDFTLKICCEIDNDHDELYCYSLLFTVNDNEYELENGQNFDSTFSSFEDFLENQILYGREKVKHYQRVTKLLYDIEDFANNQNLDLDIVREIAENQIAGWY